MDNQEITYKVRQTNMEDLPALVGIKGNEALHRDRIRDVSDEKTLYPIIERNGKIIGFGLLVFASPSNWTDFNPDKHLPMMIDVFIKPDCRNRSAGTRLITWMEVKVKEKGEERLYLEVDPVENKRAFELYKRLGYKPLQDKPYKSRWKFTDSAGNLHQGTEWNIDMVKEL